MKMEQVAQSLEEVVIEVDVVEVVQCLVVRAEVVLALNVGMLRTMLHSATNSCSVAER